MEKTNESLDEPFGESFKLARESMGFSQREVAEELKLAWKTIEDLEEENFESLPPYVFVRGYVKSYCKLVALDSEMMASKLSDLYKSHAKEVAETEQKDGRRSPSRFTSIPKRQVLFGFVFFFALILIWFVDFGAQPSKRIATDESVDKAPEDKIQEVDEVGLANPVIPTNSNDLPDVTLGLSELSEDGTDQGWGAVVYSDQIQKTETFVAEEDEPDNSQALLSDEPKIEFVDIGENGSDTLVIDFNDDCWYEIGDEQENLLTSDLGRSGETKRFRGNAPFKIKLGYAPGVSIRFNGGNVELAPYTRNNIAVFNLGRRESRDE